MNEQTHLVRITSMELKLLQLLRELKEFEKIEIKKAENRNALIIFRTSHEKIEVNY